MFSPENLSFTVKGVPIKNLMRGGCKMNIGIIGSSDGPTVIYTSCSLNWIIIIVGAVLVCAAVFFIAWKVKKR